MKKTILVSIFALIGITLLANINSINLSSSGTELMLLRSNDNGMQMKLNMEEITSFEVITEEGAFSQISIEGFTHSNIIGAPKLPIIRKIISVPHSAEISAKALSYETMKYQLQDFGISNPLMPAQLPVPKSADPSETIFSYDPKAYSKNQFTSNELISVEELGIMRGVRLFVVEVSPIQYNPIEGSLLVLNNIEIKVEFIGGDHAQTQWERSRTYSPYFEATFANSIINYSHVQSRDQITQYPIKYVIISDPMFQTQLQPFIEWKTEKGFEVIEAYTDEPNVGNTTTSIKSFLQDLYDAGTPEDPAPSFVLFVGDVAQIPAWNGSTGSHVTDLNYVKLDGTNYVADMYYGRFSANNSTELQPQIDKTLEYEKYEMPDPSYLEEVVMIAGVDANFAPTHGNGQINYGTTYYFNAAHGIFSHTYLYPQSGSSSAQIIQNVSDGVGYVNYTAHGSSTSWGNPSFTIPNINGLQNEHKYGLAVGNCCLTNKFEVYTCFGEAWLRAENKGAIGYIGGTNSTYWDEDFWWGVGAGTPTANPTYESTGQGVYDGLFHDHGEDFTDWYTTTAGMIFNGNLAVTEGGGGMINYYWEIYSIMGDPSLTAYLGVPSENIATYPDVIFLGLDNIQITAEPYSYVSLTMDGVIHGNALIDESGILSLDFEAFTNPGMAKLVITRQNCEPLIDEIEVIPNAGAYIIVNSYTTNDNNNNIPEYDETITLDVDLENVGIDDATNVNITLSAEDTYITITDADETVALITAGEIVSLIEAFSFDVADNIPDQHQVAFDVEMIGDEGTWNSTIFITFNAPLLEAGTMEIVDSGGDGILDPGETATLLIPILNAGNAVSEDIVADLTSASPALITVINGTFDMTGLGIGEEDIASFDIEVADDATLGMIATLGLMINSGGYTSAFPYYPSIGLIMENFETGDFSLFDWQMGTFGWVIDNTNAYEGEYCAKSTTITHNQTASISVTMDVATDGEISFYKKVSSESNYDYLRFYINNQQQDQWAGTIAWSQETYPVTAGTDVEFKWEYDKDGSVSTGSDCAWIDEIIFPSVGGGDAPIISLSTEEIDFGNVEIGDTATEQLTIFNLGTVELNGTISAPEVFSPELTDYSVEAGGNLVIDIEFTPMAAMTYSGDLIITSNDPNQSEVTVALSGTGVSTGNDLDLIPTVTELTGNYPNPFNPTTNVNFSLKADSKVSLIIYNVRGQRVKTLVAENMQAGYHSIVWDGRDDNGKSVSSGVYFSGFDASDKIGDYTSVKKMILLK